jgi:hypothetical protein
VRVRAAAVLQELWLQCRAVWGWRDWLRLRVRWRQFDAAVVTHWTNLHLSAAWRAWRGWQLQKQQKRQAEQTVARRWTNLHLAAAFQAWWELVQVHRHRKAVCETVAGRWRNLHTAAAFGAWRSFVRQQALQRSAQTAVAARWNNLHLAMAFGAWREAVAEAAVRSEAAAAAARRLEQQLLAAALLGWREVATRKAAVRNKGSTLQQRWRRQQLQRGLDGWHEAVAWQAAKRHADAHWRQVVLRSALALWWSHTQRKASYTRVSLPYCAFHSDNRKHAAALARARASDQRQGLRLTAVHDCRPPSPMLLVALCVCLQNVLLLLSRAELQVLRRSFASWRDYTTYRQQKAVADEYAASVRLVRVFSAWSALANESRQRADAANSLAARLQARSRSQLLQASLISWKQYSAYYKQKAAADAYAHAKLQQRVFWGWLVLAADARQRHASAASMAAGVAARAAHELRLACFAGWQMRAVRTRTVKVRSPSTQLLLVSLCLAVKGYTMRFPARAAQLLFLCSLSIYRALRQTFITIALPCLTQYLAGYCACIQHAPHAPLLASLAAVCPPACWCITHAARAAGSNTG